MIAPQLLCPAEDEEEHDDREPGEKREEIAIGRSLEIKPWVTSQVIAGDLVIGVLGKRKSADGEMMGNGKSAFRAEPRDCKPASSHVTGSRTADGQTAHCQSGDCDYSKAD